jgi:IS5 family transposase
VKLHDRLVAIAREKGAVRGYKMRVDTTVVESNIHYPTDSSLLADGARVLTRTMKKIEAADRWEVEAEGARSNPQREQASPGDCHGRPAKSSRE